MSLLHRIKPAQPVKRTQELQERVTAKSAGRKPSGKVVVSLRLEPDVLEAWRSTGPGYQARMNDALKRHAPLPLKGC